MAEKRKRAEMKTIPSYSWSVQDAISWCTEQGKEPSDVTITGGHLTYSREETDEEAEAQEKHAAQAKATQLKWFKGMYDEMMQAEGQQ